MFSANNLNQQVGQYKTSPEEMMFLTSQGSPSDFLCISKHYHSDEKAYQEAIKDLDKIVLKRKETRDKQRKYRNQRKKLPKFEPGDIVFCSEHKIIKKATGLRAKFSGPSVVLAKDSNFGYILKNLATNKVFKRSAEFVFPATTDFIQGLMSPYMLSELEEKDLTKVKVNLVEPENIQIQNITLENTNKKTNEQMFFIHKLTVATEQ